LYLATSSPMMNTFSSLNISSSMAVFNASLTVYASFSSNLYSYASRKLTIVLPPSLSLDAARLASPTNILGSALATLANGVVSSAFFDTKSCEGDEVCKESLEGMEVVDERRTRESACRDAMAMIKEGVIARERMKC
jgi:hypothetical protein